MNLWSFKLIVLTFSFSLLVACGGGGDSKHQKMPAIEKIKLYAADSRNPAPTIQDYKDAGVTGLEGVDINALNEKIASLTSEDVDTVEELDDITAAFGVNILPIANAGANQTVLEGVAVSFDASASIDVDGEIITWLWVENGETLSTLKSFSKNDFSVGVHTITLTITDDDEAISSDQVIITITKKDVSNKAPIAKTGADQTEEIGTNITLDASASTDSDGTIVTWFWKENGTILSTAQSFSKSNFSLGSHTITLIVTDNDGENSSDTVIVTITEKTNKNPVAKAGVDQTAVTGTNITLDASASTDSDGTISTWLWQEGGTTLSTVQSFSKDDFSVETHTITLTVTDNDGGTSSDTVLITITDEDTANKNPVAKAGADQTAVTGANITLDASASLDSDGSISSWLWQENGATLSTAQSFSKNDFSVGVHTITLTVTDDDNATATDTVVITITDEESSSLFSIAPISDVTAPEYAFFNNAGYLPAGNDESGHYTSITPTLTGGDPIGRVVYTLGGVDAEEFIINKKTGLVVLDYKDFEHPTDANTDNVYEITITATDEGGNTDSESWKVTITDVAGESVSKHIISMNGASLMRVKKGQAFVDPGATVIPLDNGANVELRAMIYSNYEIDPELPSINTNNPNDKVYHIIYKARDTANSALSAPEVSRTIIVEDDDDFASLGQLTSINVTGTDGSQKTFSSLEEDYIQTALYYAKAHGGGTVHLNSGVHYFKRQLVVYSNTTLEGSTSGGNITSTLKLNDFAVRKAWKNSSLSFGNSYPLIINASGYIDNYQFAADKTEESSQNIGIKDLIIDGNRENQRSWKSAGSNNSIGIKIENTSGIVVDNIKLYNTLSDGISTISSSNLSVRNSIFRFMGHSALFITETENVTTDNLTIDVLSNSGIRFFGGTDFTITNNHIFCTTNGGNYAIQISNNYSAGKPVDNVLIENNIIRHTAYAGIALYTSSINDIIQGVTIQNNIIYGSSSVVSNMPLFLGKEANSRIHEGGSINIQHAKDVNINHNTIFNGQGSGIRLDNRFYIPDGSAKDWNDLENLDRMLGKTASITNNVIVGNKLSNYAAYSDALAFGIEKRVAMYCGSNQNEECAGTVVTTANNIIALNDSGKASSNITLSGSDNTAFPGFVNAPLFDKDIREVSYYYNSETNLNLNLIGVDNPQIGASASLLQKSMDIYNDYKTFFTPLPE